jgi:SOS-response transcriptional repressor LexA
MPHSLNPRQREYLEFIREYIKTNESSPLLKEVAEHFGVKSPTAHKTLKTLRNAGFLYFGRDSISGFYIRLIERAGSIETVIEIPITGKVNRYGEIFDFPQKLGHFATVLLGSEPGDVFALVAMEKIPEASILTQDLLICDYGKRSQPGDIAILPWGKQSGRWVLCQIFSLTLDQDLDSLESSNQYPIPEGLLDKSHGQRFKWAPIAYGEDTEKYLIAEADKDHVPMRPIPPDFVLVTVLRLSRNLAF